MVLNMKNFNFQSDHEFLKRVIGIKNTSDDKLKSIRLNKRHVDLCFFNSEKEKVLYSNIDEGLLHQSVEELIWALKSALIDIEKFKSVRAYRVTLKEVVSTLARVGFAKEFNESLQYLIDEFLRVILKDKRSLYCVEQVYKICIIFNRINILHEVYFQNALLNADVLDDKSLDTFRKVFSSDSKLLDKLLVVHKDSSLVNLSLIFSALASTKDIGVLYKLFSRLSSKNKANWLKINWFNFRESPVKTTILFKRFNGKYNDLLFNIDGGKLLTTLLFFNSDIDKSDFQIRYNIFYFLEDLSDKDVETMFFDIRRVEIFSSDLVSDAQVYLNGFLYKNKANHLYGKRKFILSIVFRVLVGKIKCVDVDIILNFWYDCISQDKSFRNPIYSMVGLKYKTISLIRFELTKKGLIPFVSTKARALEEFYNLSLLDLSNKRLPESKSYGYGVSVILTTYNPDLNLIKYSIKSIEKQTYKKIELIIVDDCSTTDISNSLSILVNQLSNFMDIKYIRNSLNRGQYVSRNIAAKEAQYDYIAIQDDDDISHPQRIELQMKSLIHKNKVMSFTKHIRFDESLNATVDDKEGFTIVGDAPPTLIFRKNIINMIGGFRNFRSRGDIDFRSRVIAKFGISAVSILDIPLYYMRSSMLSVSSSYEYFHRDRLNHYRACIDFAKEVRFCLE